jgi:hypothetical protein
MYKKNVFLEPRSLKLNSNSNNNVENKLNITTKNKINIGKYYPKVISIPKSCAKSIKNNFSKT